MTLPGHTRGIGVTRRRVEDRFKDLLQHVRPLTEEIEQLFTVYLQCRPRPGHDQLELLGVGRRSYSGQRLIDPDHVARLGSRRRCRTVPDGQRESAGEEDPETEGPGLVGEDRVALQRNLGSSGRQMKHLGARHLREERDSLKHPALLDWGEVSTELVEILRVIGLDESWLGAPPLGQRPKQTLDEVRIVGKQRPQLFRAQRDGDHPICSLDGFRHQTPIEHFLETKGCRGLDLSGTCPSTGRHDPAVEQEMQMLGDGALTDQRRTWLVAYLMTRADYPKDLIDADQRKERECPHQPGQRRRR